MRRVLALLQAAWLALLIAEPASLHACAMHATGHAGHTTRVDAPAQGPTEDAATHEHAHHEDAPATPDDLTQSMCQCLADCCAAAAVALFTAPDFPAVARIAATRTRVTVAAQGSARAPDLRLPFANGPPSTLTT